MKLTEDSNASNDSFSSLTNVELKDTCRVRILSIRGNKANITDRIAVFIE